MSALRLTLKKRWFDMILSGEKREEYIEIKDYWARRLLWIHSEMEWACWEEMLTDMTNPFHRHKDVKELLQYFDVSFRIFSGIEFYNGYSKTAPLVYASWKGIDISEGNTEWGAEKGKYYFVLKLGSINEENCL